MRHIEAGDIRYGKVQEEVPGLSYRRLDYWTRRGYLRSRERPAEGSGYARYWPPGELAIAQIMVALTGAGLSPQAAHDVARAMVFTTEIKMAPGVYLKVVAGELVM